MSEPRLQILPSILGADVGNLEQAIRAADAGGADGIHIDVMDGHFVPNISFSPSVVAMAERVTDLPLNTHLMLTNPDKYLDAFINPGSDTLLVHVESKAQMESTLKGIREKGCRSGIVLNPDTKFHAILPYMEWVDEVLFMTVFPGFGGQKFIEDVMPGVRDLRKRYPELDIAIDGGLKRDTCKIARDAGANIFDIGSGIFGADDIGAEIDWLKDALA